MARKGSLPVDGAREHAAGDPIRISGRDARRGGRGGAGDGIGGCLLVGGKTPGSHGRRGAASSVPGRVVAGHHFLFPRRSEEHTSELQSHSDLVCRLLLEKKKTSCQ